MEEITMAFIGTPELILIIIIVLVLFGGTQIPKLMRNLGRGISEFKKGIKEGEKDSNLEEQNKETANRKEHLDQK